MDTVLSGLSVHDPLLFSYKTQQCINLYYIYNKYSTVEKITHGTLVYDNELQQLVSRYKFDDSYCILFETFRTLEYIQLDFNKILHVYIAVFGLFNFSNKHVSKTNQLSYYDIPSLNYTTLTNKLIIRPGIVELRACSTDNYDIMKESINDLFSNITNTQYILNKQHSNLDNWLSTTHNRHNYDCIIASLMTNAGFYMGRSMEESLDNFLFFKKEYKNAIINADYIMHWSFVNCFALNILNDKKQIKDVSYIDTANVQNIVSLLDNKSILFLTPFKTLIDELYASKNIYKLRPSTNLTNIHLHTIEAFLTTYPNRKHNSFIETYNYYTQEIDKMFSENTYDIFTCSCGCYGLLMCNYVYTKYNITCLYIGNFINNLFGISFSPKDADTPFYLKSDLHKRYQLMENIENNLYGYKE